VSNDEAQPDDPRRNRLLEAALGVFNRFGYRKTSMEEVARAADVSRQALYLRFETKEALFRAAVEFVLSSALRSASASLDDDHKGLDARLTGAFEAWVGNFWGVFEGEAKDMLDAGSTIAGAELERFESRFVEAVTRAVRSAGLAAAYSMPGLTAKQLASTLYATAKGLKYQSKSRAAFTEQLALAARLLCAPLRSAKK
jgi:AcrR family transcriptional regulator